MKRQIIAASLALILVFAFAGTALAYDWDAGSWNFTVYMKGFTAYDPLTKTGTDWILFTPKPSYVRYADNNYRYERWMNAYVKNSAGTRMSGVCVCWALEDDNVSIYGAANDYNTLRVRIENLECNGEYNMKSYGTFKADWN